MIVDLEKFCDLGRRASGSDLSKPFSLNGHTYATNGHIAVRVPRCPDIPENKDAPNAEERLPWDFSRIKFGPPPELAPEPNKCRPCEGRGYKHDCPQCGCECEHCHGTGEHSPIVRIGNAVFDARYIELMQALPGLGSQSLETRYRFGSMAARALLCRSLPDDSLWCRLLHG